MFNVLNSAENSFILYKNDLRYEFKGKYSIIMSMVFKILVFEILRLTLYILWYIVVTNFPPVSGSQGPDH